MRFLESQYNDESRSDEKMRNKLNHRWIRSQLEYRLYDSILRHFNDCDIVAGYIINTIHSLIENNQRKKNQSSKGTMLWMDERESPKVNRYELKYELRRSRTSAIKPAKLHFKTINEGKEKGTKEV